MINWEMICGRIAYWNTDLGYIYAYAEGNPMEAIEVASAGGCLPDMDDMIHLKEILGFPITYAMFSYFEKHYDGSLMELGKEDLPALYWLLNDYVINGKEIMESDIWDRYDFDSYADKYGFCGWHKRVTDGIAANGGKETT